MQSRHFIQSMEQEHTGKMISPQDLYHFLKNIAQNVMFWTGNGAVAQPVFNAVTTL